MLSIDEDAIHTYYTKQIHIGGNCYKFFTKWSIFLFIQNSDIHDCRVKHEP